MATPPNIDGIVPPELEASMLTKQPLAAAAAPRRWKLFILASLVSAYAILLLWGGFLLAVLPDATGAFRSLVAPGVLSMLGLGLLLTFLGAFAFIRVFGVRGRSRLQRTYGMLRGGLAVVPGIVFAAVVALLIAQEPALPLQIVDPPTAAGLVAPVTVTFSLQRAVSILQAQGLTPVKYAWDFTGNGKQLQQTAQPTASAYFEQQGSRRITAVIGLEGGATRTVSMQLNIPTAVFAVQPQSPIAGEPVRFSVEHLQTEANPIREVQWDLNGDGKTDQTTTELAATTTYVAATDVNVTATILYTNQVVQPLSRVVTVREPESPAFAAAIATTPEFRKSPPPFGLFFTVETAETIRSIAWDFGDGENDSGTRVGHTYARKGVYRVTADVVNSSGATVSLSTVVQVVDPLTISDLSFESDPPVERGSVRGPVPLTVRITPQTVQPLVEFQWEAPDASIVESSDTTLQATYRRTGEYTAVLVATDPSGKVLRTPVKITVEEPNAGVMFRMQPEGGIAPLTVRFDASETEVQGQEISGFEWMFGDENSKRPLQAGAIVEHLYDHAGTFTVTATAFTTTGQQKQAEKTIVIRPPVLDACATASRVRGKAPLGVSFSMACSTGTPKSILWSFGDGATTDEPQPKHVFETPGTYTAALELTDAAGTTDRQEITITVEPS